MSNTKAYLNPGDRSVIMAGKTTSHTVVYEGKTYPYVTIDVSSASHPFYTGKQKSAQSDGRVARFNKRYGRQAKS